MATPGPRQLTGVADDYAKALAALERRSVANTLALLRRSLAGTLVTLRRSYNAYLSDLGPLTRDDAGQQHRRPGAYTTAESTAKFRAILQDAQQFMTPAELVFWREGYERDLREATQLGGDLATELIRMVSQPDSLVPFAGADPLAIRAAALNASAFIQNETARFRNQIVEIVGEGVARGWGPSRLERQIREALRGARDPKRLNQRLGLEQRAALIARSELATAYVKGSLQRARERGDGYVRVLASNDERTCPTCASRNGRIYPVDRVPIPWHPRCVLGDTKVSPGLLAAVFRSVYRGNVVSIGLASGERLTVTVDHPVLTTAGWVKAEALRKGDKVVGHGLHRTAAATAESPDLNQVPAAAEDVFAAFADACAMPPVAMPVTPLDLHGDGQFIEGDVEVVRSEGLLNGYWEAKGDDSTGQHDGINRRVRFRPFTTFSHSDAAILGLGAAASGSVSRFREALAILSGGLSHAEEHRIAAAAWSDPMLVQEGGDISSLNVQLLRDGLDTRSLVVELQRQAFIEHQPIADQRDPSGLKVASDDVSRYPELLSELGAAHPGLVELHEVVSVEINPFHGFVYTFETFCGAYAVGDGVRIVNRNCRCITVPVPDEAIEESDPETQDLLLDSKRWREEHERGVEAYAKARGVSIEKARTELARALQTPTASERRLYPKGQPSLRESVPLFRSS